MKFNKRAFVCSLLLCLLICSVNVWAQVKPGAYTITPFIGGYCFEGDEGIDDDVTHEKLITPILKPIAVRCFISSSIIVVLPEFENP